LTTGNFQKINKNLTSKAENIIPKLYVVSRTYSNGNKKKFSLEIPSQPYINTNMKLSILPAMLKKNNNDENNKEN
jgi:hypothetical protein